MRSSPLLLALLLTACGTSSGGASVATIDASTSPVPDGASPQNGGDAGLPVAKDGSTTTNPDAGTPAGDAGTGVATIRVHYPTGSHKITLRGASSPYSWTTGVPLTPGASDTWTLSTPSLSAPLQFKPLLDDMTWSRGPNYAAPPGATVDIYPHFTTITGAYSNAFQFTSSILGNTRGVWVYLPPSYNENTLATFPVVYMHDGQNLFDPAAAFGGNTWQIGQTMDAAAEDGSIAEAIIVGPENTSDRIAEYTPVTDPTTPTTDGAKGALYLQMLITELKPKIDATYRTVTDRDHTFMMGSSLGGLITAYASVERADVYGGFGVMSPSTWWDNSWILGEVATMPMHAVHPNRVYLDSGNAGASNDDVTQTAQLDAQYQSVGFVQGSTLDYLVQNGGQHSEIYWAQRAPGALAFLVGPRAYR